MFQEKCNSIDVNSLSTKSFFVFFTLISEIHFLLMMLFIKHKLKSSYTEFSEKYLKNEEEIKKFIDTYILSVVETQFYSEYDYFFTTYCNKFQIDPDLDLPTIEEIKELILAESKEKQEKMFDDMLQEYVFSPMSSKRAKYIIDSTPNNIQ
jgi:hypothetical protein